jgi:hypothetical protein
MLICKVTLLYRSPFCLIAFTAVIIGYETQWLRKVTKIYQGTPKWGTPVQIDRAAAVSALLRIPVHKNAPQVAILNHVNPAQNLTTYVFGIYFSIVLPSTARSIEE